MALWETPPFRADHVGSLLRPPELLEARGQHAQGELDAEQLREIEDEAIRAVVGLTAFIVGIPIVFLVTKLIPGEASSSGSRTVILLIPVRNGPRR